MELAIIDFRPSTGPGPRPAGARPLRPSGRDRLLFRDPEETIRADEPDDVVPALHRIEAAARAGLHAVGYLAYEAAPAFEPAMQVRPAGRLPLLEFGLFERPADVGWRAAGEAGAEAESPGRDGTAATLEWRLRPERGAYEAAVVEVRRAIAEGRTYQVNLSARLGAPAPEGFDPRAFYNRIRRAQGDGYHALLDLGDHVLMSASPELFFRTAGRAVTTRPMKGTRPRGRWPAEDAALAAELRGSPKDRAENLMVVDLLRNDLGRVCETGSIRAPALFELERYRTVWQMTSTVLGTLRDDVGLAELLGALFPCGSVTGAPKISTMAEIARLETAPRGVYCGAIGWVRPGCDATFSVPIRTAWLDREAGRLEYGVGGGVVWDSTPEAEYAELEAKAALVREAWPAFELVETLGLHDGRPIRRERHLARLRASADYFGFAFPADALEDALGDLVRDHPTGAFLARITLAEDGRITAGAEPLETRRPESPPALVQEADTAVDSRDRFLFHKTTRRSIYELARSGQPEYVFDTLLRNERGEVTEFTRGNLVAELDGERITPPLSAGLLPGCLREELLERGAVTERTILTADLGRAARLWFINSARGWIEVRLS